MNKRRETGVFNQVIRTMQPVENNQNDIVTPA
jgi:hypothetical protein